jgi:hypothetical protein
LLLQTPSIFDGINQKKDKKEDIYVLLFDESLIQQLKKKPAGHPSYTGIKLFFFIILLIDSIKYGQIPKTAKEHDSVLQGPFVCYHIG